MKTPVTPTKDGVTISLYVQPGASKTGWAGLIGESVKLRVAARPVEGEANREVCAYLAKFFEVTKSAVTIVHGSFGRHKTVRVDGDTQILISKLQPIIEVREI